MQNTTNQETKPCVIYDGECRFCIDKINRIKKLDRNSELMYIPRQDPAAEAEYPQIKNVDLEEGLLFVAEDGTVHVAADAIYQIACVVPDGKRVAWLYRVPIIKQIIQIGYRIIAINRKRLGQTCDNGLCTLSSQDGTEAKH